LWPFTRPEAPDFSPGSGSLTSVIYGVLVRVFLNGILKANYPLIQKRLALLIISLSTYACPSGFSEAVAVLLWVLLHIFCGVNIKEILL
jgi:TctA family transporter